MNTVEIGNRIKTAREEKGLTQEELGIRLGLNKSTIQRYEAGENSVCYPCQYLRYWRGFFYYKDFITVFTMPSILMRSLSAPTNSLG